MTAVPIPLYLEPEWQNTFEFPEPPGDAAYHGLPGDVVRLLGPHTEGAEVAILAQFLAGFGNMVTDKPYFPVGGDRHRANLFVGLVGETGKGRKGSSLSVALAPLDPADPKWETNCRARGLSTGEGIIHRLRDASEDAKGNPVAGVTDKRLLALESEFARVLTAAGRDGNTLSMILRQGWDGQTLETLTKTSAERATGAHLSLVGHVTVADLRRYLQSQDVLNGFANRIIWTASRRARILPEGGALPPRELAQLADRVRTVIASIERWPDGCMARDAAASKLWADAYPLLTEGRTGAFGAVTGRADVQTLRLSMVYALADGSKHIQEPHLRAALALWDYSERTALWVFGSGCGHSGADLVLEELRAAYPGSLARQEIRDLLGRNASTDEVVRILLELELIVPDDSRRTKGPGRPATYWRANPTPPAIGIRGITDVRHA